MRTYFANKMGLGDLFKPPEHSRPHFQKHQTICAHKRAELQQLDTHSVLKRFLLWRCPEILNAAFARELKLDYKRVKLLGVE